jgi:hypothetical protein
MKEIVKLGLVMGVLFCTAFGAASAQEELSEDYKEGYQDGFYTSAMLLIGANLQGASLADLYYSLNGEPTDETLTIENETMTWSDYYNHQAEVFNQEAVPEVNNFILQIFGHDDERTEQLLLPELPLIT